MRRLLLAALAACVLAPAATAGGWATVQLSAVPTDGTAAGKPVGIDITVLQHGRTPLDGVTPVFRVRDGGGKVVASYRGVPTGKPGVYHVDVEFPSAGTYRYEVHDGFGTYGGAQTHTFAPVEIAAPEGGGGIPVSVWAMVGAVLAVAAAAVGLARRRGPAAAPPAPAR